jgi:hypothetical protein
MEITLLTLIIYLHVIGEKRYFLLGIDVFTLIFGGRIRHFFLFKFDETQIQQLSHTICNGFRILVVNTHFSI